ncbi:MAG: non-homologous end-joining DNA ligase [Chlamydiales bacterium]
MGLSTYKKKRDLKVSMEPSAKIRKAKGRQLSFVIQEHHARRLHYDLRLEAAGVLKSWAIPKMPTMDPGVKRLAIMVEDHPYSYKNFEGTIPAGYGAGTVSIWDEGTYEIDHEDAKTSEKLLLAGLKKGSFHFTLHGKKLKGSFSLVRMNSEKNEWLLVKKRQNLSRKSKVEKKINQPKLTNLDKVFWPKEKITKGDVLRYYDKIAPWILPYLKDRPESLKRFPNGVDGESFFQKDVKEHPDWIETTRIKHENKTINYLLIQNEVSLLFVANLGCIEIHPFFSRFTKPDYPDYMIFDLDPKEASFDDVVRVAKEVHVVLEEIEVASYCKTSGATGLHVTVPLGAKYTYDQVKRFAEVVAMIVHSRLPEITTLERSIAKRKGKVYIDCYQNNFGQTIAAAYSLRARPGAPVSTPLKWKEVKKGLDPKKYNIKTIFSRLKRLKDIYFPVLGKGANLEAALRNVAKLLGKN